MKLLILIIAIAVIVVVLFIAALGVALYSSISFQ